MIVQVFGCIFSARRGWSKNPPPTQKGSIFPTYQTAQFWAGYEAGINKSRKIQEKALEHEIKACEERDLWKGKYKSEIGQLKQLVNDLRAQVSDDVWRSITQGKRQPSAPSSNADEEK